MNQNKLLLLSLGVKQPRFIIASSLMMFAGSILAAVMLDNIGAGAAFFSGSVIANICWVAALIPMTAKQQLAS